VGPGTASTVNALRSPSAPPVAFAGAVLCGGESRRMGRDKALATLGGVALARRVADALLAAGAAPVVAVGGDAPRLAALGLVVVPDRTPGEGPLGAVITALGSIEFDVVAVLATDLVAPDPRSVRRLVAALAASAADVAVPTAAGRRHHHHAVWRRRAHPVLLDAFAEGERAIKRALDRLVVLEVPGLDPETLDDADRPDELARAASRLIIAPGSGPDSAATPGPGLPG
jgi:molybdopterin-guanine dinucleotide biosynthesis protein A